MSIDRNKLAELAQESNFYKGHYRNISPTLSHGLGDFLKWQMAPGKRFPPGHQYSLHHPDLHRLERPGEQPQLTWIGHSSFLFQFSGRNVLTDPVFSERASPFRFAGPKRYTPAALQVVDLPHIDLVLISHNHYDHLDETTIKQLYRRFGDEICFAVPQGLARWFRQRGISNLIERNWWQAADIDQGELFCLPAQHFSGRGPLDGNTSVWCGWLLVLNDYRFYFAGDTGYGDIFKQIGDIFAPLDLALLPIGAYDPRWFMSPVHVAPEESVKIHQDIGARQSVAMHWGAFALTDEPMDEPPRRLRQALREQGIDEHRFRVMEHGQTLHFVQA